MDACSFTIDTARELRLHRHIRQILLPYARAHITSDHVAFTEMVVEELLLQALEHVPMADATSFLLPTEPFEVLMRPLGTLDPIPPEERWVMPAEHVRYLRTFFPPPPSPADLRSEGSWHEDDDRYTRLSKMYRPVSPPILSKRSMRESARLGSASIRAYIPRTKTALTALLNLQPVLAQNIEDLPTPPIDEVLDLRLKIGSDIGAAIRPFLQSVLGPPPTGEESGGCFEETPHMLNFLNRDSPPRYPPSLDSPPLFTRGARGRVAHRCVNKKNVESCLTIPTRIPDLVSMFRLASPEFMPTEDGDINGHHMQVVDGWTTLKFSSPPPPSLHSSVGSEVDELWDLSPPGTPATSLLAAKMDEVEIPRIRKFGHKNTLVDESMDSHGTASLLANGPGFFITSFISAPIPTTQAAKPTTSQLGGVKIGMHSPRPLRLSPSQCSSNSLIGKPPSAPERGANEETSAAFANCGFEEQLFNDAVASIYASTPQDPLSYIREEKLDDKEIMLMEVPNLPPPTAHHKDPILFPGGIQELVLLKGELSRLEKKNHGSNYPLSFLRPVKGIKPLALDLSWRPFNFGKSIPTDEEVAGIMKPIRPEDEGPGYLDHNYEKMTTSLLDLCIPPISAEGTQAFAIPMAPRICEEIGTSPTPKRAEETGHVEFLLTQRERARASRFKNMLETRVETEHGVDIGDGAIGSDNNDHGAILTLDENLHQGDECQGSRIHIHPMDCHSEIRTDYDHVFDDSGIDIMDNDFSQFSTSKFGFPSLLLCSHQDDLRFAMGPTEANKENTDDDNQSENKENDSPLDVGDTHLAESQPDLLDNLFDWNSYFEIPEPGTSPFVPLSFASQGQLAGTSDHFTDSKAQEVLPLIPSHPQRARDIVPPDECEQTFSRATKRRKLDDLVPASSKDLFTTFIGLRSQNTSSLTLEHSGTRNDAPTPHLTQDVPDQILPRVAPDDVFDPHTIRLPEHWVPAAAVHRYLASMSLIQKRALVHELQGHRCRTVLVERHDLGGTDIIIDPDYGVLFMTLFALPAHLDSAIARISCASWRYPNLLVVFEAFPSAQSYKADRLRDVGQVPYAYTPPVCNAIRKLRRITKIAEGCGTMNPRCTVIWAFANDVEEAAKFVRCFGEEACAIRTERGQGVLWDERAWLEEEEREGESDLARVHSMNAFAAFVMLYDKSLEDILDLSPEARLAEFGQLLGQERVMELNSVIESRMQQIAPELTDSVVDPRC